MFFTLSKIFWMICAPMTLIAILVGVGAVFYRYSLGKYALRIGAGALLVIGFLPVGQNMLVYLENQNPLPVHLPARIDGIIVLGGSIDLQKSIAHKQTQLNENAPRITEMIALSKKYPRAKIVFTGGDGNLHPTSSSESEQLNILLKNIGFNTSRIVYEGKSRNTFENMQFSKELVKPVKEQSWLLVTSAFHIPRSAAIFSSNGWDVIPYPAGYLTDGRYHTLPSFDVLGNMYKFQVAAREYIGIMAYTLTGRIQTDEDEDVQAGSDFSSRSAGDDNAGQFSRLGAGVGGL